MLDAGYQGFTNTVILSAVEGVYYNNIAQQHIPENGFLDSAPVLSYESKNGGFGRNDRD